MSLSPVIGMKNQKTKSGVKPRFFISKKVRYFYCRSKFDFQIYYFYTRGNTCKFLFGFDLYDRFFIDKNKMNLVIRTIQYTKQLFQLNDTYLIYEVSKKEINKLYENNLIDIL